MPTTVRDASLVTKKNRDIALNNYYNDWKTNTVSAARPTTALTTPGFTGAETLTQAKAGCVECTINTNADPLTTPVDRNLLPLPNPSRGGAGSTTTTS
jgi:hypothetical protein